MTPRAVLLEAPGRLRLTRRPYPGVRAGHALVAIASAGICGTDVSIYKGKIEVRYPLVMGHEIAGRVVEVPPDVEGWSRGDRVIVDPVVFCGHCYHCSKHQTHLCPHGFLMGRDGDGGFQDLLEVPATNLHRLPEEIPDQVAPLIQVLTVCTHGQRFVDIFPGESVLVIGLGVTGLLHLQLAAARGAGPVIGITRSESKRQLAERLGAAATFHPSDPRLEESVRELTEGRGPDVVIESAGTVETLAQAIRLVRVGGQLMIYGTITAHSGELPFYQLYYKELRITNPRAARPEDFPAAISMVRDGTVRLQEIVTDVLPLPEADRALEATGRSDTLKVILVNDAEALP